MKDIRQWLTALGLAEYGRAFEDNAIDFRALPSLTEDDLKELGLKLGHRRILQQAIAALEPESPVPADARASETPSPSPLAAPERRQLTVMFCDLVGSVDLGQRMDVEDYRELLARFRDTVTAAVEAHSGFVARHQGDALLAYFGYPHAQEDDAERAVRAGLHVVDAVQRLHMPSATPIRVRVGIATGETIVGDLLATGQLPEVAALGPTPNLAARLQGSARPGCVLISELTARLVRSRFECAPVALELKGYEGPITAFEVAGEVAGDTRPMLADTAALTPFVGRSEELAVLTGRWRRALEGEGQVVLLCGEPGVGKSRLVRELIGVIGAEARRLVPLHGSRYHQSSPLHPIRVRLEQALTLAADAPVASRRRTIDVWLREQGLDADALGPWFAALLLPQHAPALDADVQRRRIRRALLAWLVEGQAVPAIVAVEDVHWLDPSTVDLLGELVEHVRDRRFMVLATHRPEFAAPWGDPGHQTTLVLKGLSRREVGALTRLAAGDATLPATTIEAIVERADGLPLFAEELARAVIEDEAVSLAGGPPPASTPVPATLRDSLTARLDRLGPAKAAAQAASVIGRAFTTTMLAQVLDADAHETRSRLAPLVRSGLVLRDRGQGDDAYVFKHALVRDAAYESMLKARRRELHGRVASALGKAPGAAQPELLAHHCTEAGLPEPAIEHWLAAGKHAAEQAAYAEAVAHLTRGLGLLESLPEGTARARREIDLRVALGVPLMKDRSVRSEEVGANYRRARELCESLGAAGERFPVLWGQWYHHMLRFDVRRACELADELLVTGRDLAEEPLVLEAHHCQWASRFLAGDLAASLEHADQGLRLYRAESHHPLMFVYGGHDPGVCAHDVGALVLWLSGHAQPARERIGQALALARRLGQPSTLANALAKALTLAGLRRDLDEMERLGGQLLQYVQGDVSEQSRPHAMAALAWVTFERGRREEGLAGMREAVGAGLLEDPWNVYLASMVAAALAGEGAVDEGLELVDAALERSQENAVHWWEPELLRAKGELLRRTGACSADDAGTWLERALAAARSRGAGSLELRSAISLARHREERGRRDEARGVLRYTLGRLGDGADRGDLGQATALLKEMS